MSADMNVGTLTEAVTTLYGGDPADFVARRKELVAAARAAGDRDAAREIAALRKPTAPAAAVNHLDDDAIRDVLALGEQMRAAQTSLDAAALKELSARRQELLQQIVARHDLNGALAEAVRSTLLAAIADRQAADAVATRALVRPLSYSGWGDVDLTDAVAHRDASARPTLRLVTGGADDADGADDRARRAEAATSASSTASTADGASPQVTGSERQRDEDEREKAEREALDQEAERQAAERESAQRRRAEQERREAAALAEMDARIARLRARVEAAQNAYDAARAARDSARAALEEALLRRSSMPGGTSSSSSS